MTQDDFGQLRDAMRELDTALREEFSGVRAPASLRAGIRRRIERQRPERVSVIPSILDWLAWSSIVVAVALLLRSYLPSLLV